MVLGTVDNMFVRYRFEVRRFIREGSNKITVEIGAPAEAASIRAKNNKITPPECPPDKYYGECHMNFLRKMQASFAWDWGPAVPSLGIWKPVTLESYDVLFIRDITYNVIPVNHTLYNLNFTCYMEAGLTENVEVTGVLTATIE